MYDYILIIKRHILLIINTIRLCLISYRNIKFTGLQNIYYKTLIYGRKKGEVILGRRIAAKKNVMLVAVGGKLLIGDQTLFNENVKVVSHEKIEIGSKCMFGPNVCVYDHDHRFDSHGILSGYKSSPIIIENNCWVGANVTILRGTHIGEGCVIGAGSTIKGDIPAHSIVKSKRELIIIPIDS